MISLARLPRIGISAIGLYEPLRRLPNDWFADILPSKFVRQTGVESRRISDEDEVTMALRAVEALRERTGCDLRDCAGIVLVASSLLPSTVARRYVDAGREVPAGPAWAARQLAARLEVSTTQVCGINWGCSGYPKGLALARRALLPAIELRREQFLLVVTTNRTSRIVDYGCRQTAGLFGDYAQATLLSRLDSTVHPVAFELLYASAEDRPARGVFFEYHWRENVLVPTVDGGRDQVPERLVFSLDGMGIGDAAPRAMAAAAEKSLRICHVAPQQVRYVVPHQAGAGIVRLTAMKLESVGVQAEVINGWTRDVGNISSSSVPYALQKEWDRLDGIILCPTAGVGNPGEATVTQGCAVLRRV